MGCIIRLSIARGHLGFRPRALQYDNEVLVSMQNNRKRLPMPILFLFLIFFFFFGQVWIHWLPWWLSSEESVCNAGDMGSIPRLRRSLGGGHGNSFQYSCLENAMNREAWWATVHGVAKSQT